MRKSEPRHAPAAERRLHPVRVLRGKVHDQPGRLGVLPDVPVRPLPSVPSAATQPMTVEEQLIVDLASFSRDPLGWVMYAFDWGQGELADFPNGPEPWQRELLGRVRDGLITYTEAIREAVASGHGIGKSALVAWLILWAISTFEDTRGVVTANTATQLTTKTWPELYKWHRLFIAKHWFTVTATSIYSTDPEHEKNWRFDAVPWSLINTEAFAGLHNLGRRVVLIFDEASAIHDTIWEVSEGALTDEGTEILWFAFGNPTRKTGRFHACFHTLKHRWHHQQIDSRTVSLSNKTQIKQWEQDYGADSDFFKIRVTGEFPNTSDRQFIPSDIVEAARGRKLGDAQWTFAPVIISLDNAWTGGDEAVIWKRQGLASWKLGAYPRNDDDTVMAGYLARFEDEHKADAVFIDIGYGTGVFSAGKQMGRKWTLVSFASHSNDEGFLNKRAEMWGLMKKWLQEGGAIPDDLQLVSELTGPEYVVKLNGKIVLESKDDMKKRGLSSPNRADALALTFAFPVRKKVSGVGLAKRLEFARTEYDVLAI